MESVGAGFITVYGVPENSYIIISRTDSQAVRGIDNPKKYDIMRQIAKKSGCSEKLCLGFFFRKIKI